jgi:hypothetical protein
MAATKAGDKGESKITADDLPVYKSLDFYWVKIYYFKLQRI